MTKTGGKLIKAAKYLKEIKDETGNVPNVMIVDDKLSFFIKETLMPHLTSLNKWSQETGINYKYRYFIEIEGLEYYCLSDLSLQQIERISKGEEKQEGE